MTVKCPKCQHVNPDDTLYCGQCGTGIRGDIPDSPESDASSRNSNDKTPQDRKIPPSVLKDQVSVTRTLETSTDELTRGMIFAGRYEIIEELGTGGMGSVYRAEDTKIRQEVALKLIRPEIASSRRTIERFRNEIKTARMIAHRNVCRMFDLGEEKGTYFITMEYVSGEDMKSFLRRAAPLSPGRAVSIGKQICEGLAEAHRLGVVHRDLKPGNIMIDKEGSARIMDFGIARSLAQAGTTAEGVIIGTPEYMSPEQVEGKPADQRADIYSLGAILFEMVTGRPPFEGETTLAVAHKHRYEPAPDPRALNPQLPVDLSRLILRCLEKDREKRYQTSADVMTELNKIEQQIPSTDRVTPTRRPFTSKEITVKFTVRKMLLPVLALGAVIVVALLGWRLFLNKPPAPAPAIENSIAVISLRNQTGDTTYDYLCQRAIPDLLITNLENSGYFFYVATWERMIELLGQIGKRDVQSIDS
ncbi:MAG: serine/threonine-protein kinase, partial [Candidatus Aminicenantales bacterium]